MGIRRAYLPFAVLLASTLSQPMGAGAADSSAVPTLNNEALMGTHQTVMAQCNPDGISTISYYVSGRAGGWVNNRFRVNTNRFDANGGPFPGAFTEQGTLTMGPQVVSGTSVFGGSLQTWNVSFTISSGSGLVTGTATLTGPGGTGFCMVEPNGLLEQDAWGTSPPYNFAYTASITSGRFHGTFTDGGETDPEIFAPNPYSSVPNWFFEYFASSFSTAVPTT